MPNKNELEAGTAETFSDSMEQMRLFHLLAHVTATGPTI